MIEAIAVVVCLGIYFFSLRSPAGNGFDWVKFWALLGMFAVFMLAFALPIIRSNMLYEHPGWGLALLFGGILLFVLGITAWGLKRKQMRAAQGR